MNGAERPEFEMDILGFSVDDEELFELMELGDPELSIETQSNQWRNGPYRVETYPVSSILLTGSITSFVEEGADINFICVALEGEQVCEYARSITDYMLEQVKSAEDIEYAGSPEGEDVGFQTNFALATENLETSATWNYSVDMQRLLASNRIVPQPVLRTEHAALITSAPAHHEVKEAYSENRDVRTQVTGEKVYPEDEKMRDEFPF